MSTNGTPPSSPLSIKYPPYAREHAPGSARYSPGRIPAPGESHPVAANSTNSSGGGMWGRFVAWLGFSQAPDIHLTDRLVQLEREVAQLQEDNNFFKKRITVLEERFENFASPTKPNTFNNASHNNKKDTTSQFFSDAEDLNKFNKRINELEFNVQSIINVASLINGGLQQLSLPSDWADRAKTTNKSTVQQRETIDVQISDPKSLQRASPLPYKNEQPSLAGSDPALVERDLAQDQRPAQQDASRSDVAAKLKHDLLDANAANKSAVLQRKTIGGFISDAKSLQDARASLHKVQQPSAAGSDPALVERGLPQDQRPAQQDASRSDVAAKLKHDILDTNAANKSVVLRRKTIGGSFNDPKSLQDARASLHKVQQPSLAGSKQSDSAIVNKGLSDGQNPIQQDAPHTDVAERSVDTRNGVKDFARRFERGVEDAPLANGSKRLSLNPSNAQKAAPSVPTIEEEHSALPENLNNSSPHQIERTLNQDTQQAQQEITPPHSVLKSIKSDLLIKGKAQLKKHNPNPFI